MTTTRRADPFANPVFVPEVDKWLVVQLPGERMRAMVRGVPDDDTAIVELMLVPLQHRSHRYKKGDYVPCRRKFTGLEEIWESVDERQLAMAQAIKRLREQEAHEAQLAEAESQRKEAEAAARATKRSPRAAGKKANAKA
jgi:hypothetical protein